MLSFLSSLFNTKMLCCYCLKKIDRSASQCEWCKKENPHQYAKHYDTARPFYMPLIGWTDVGKTIWMYSLTRRLKELAGRVSENFTSIPANEKAMMFDRRVKAAAVERVPEPTQMNELIPYVIVLQKLPSFADRTLVMRDVSGEHFKDFTFDPPEIDALKTASACFLMLSLPDLIKKEKQIEGFAMDQLLMSYVHTLGTKFGVDTRKSKRSLVVILSKADALAARSSTKDRGGASDDYVLPEHLQDYLENDPMATAVDSGRSLRWTAVEFVDYVEKMQAVSDQIRNWVRVLPDGANFINFANSQNIDLKFSLVSCLSSESDDASPMGQIWEPRRVIDPLLWGLVLHGAAHSSNR